MTKPNLTGNFSNTITLLTVCHRTIYTNCFIFLKARRFSVTYYFFSEWSKQRMSCITRIPHTRRFVNAATHIVCLIRFLAWCREARRSSKILSETPSPHADLPSTLNTHTHSLTLRHQLFCPSSIPIHLTFSLGIPMCSLPSFFSLHLPFFPYCTVPEQFSHPDTCTMQTRERDPTLQRGTQTHIMDLVKKGQIGTKEIKTAL